MTLASESDLSPSQSRLSGHVLVAEDDRVNQFYAVELVKWIGCTCDVASNGQEVLAALSRTHYDAVLMDCQMPQMDGFTAACEIRSWEASGQLAGHLPLIALTALGEDRQRCLEAGMDDFLTKPLLVPQLQAILKKHLNR